jgi:hypothetical protein
MKYIKSFFVGILVYILGFILLVLGVLFGFEGILHIRGKHEILALAITACLPFIMVFSKSLKTGFGYFVASLFIANAVFPALDWSSGSPTPKFGKMSLNPQPHALESSNDSAKPYTISGTYERNDDGITSKIMILEDSWYAETFMDDGGTLISSSTGVMDGKDILGEYGVKIGYIENGAVHLIINDTWVRLTKE